MWLWVWAIRKLDINFERVSIAGTSAGGGAALNLAIERQNEIYSAASLCGRLEKGINDGIQGFDKRTATLEGAHNLTVPWGEHAMTIGVSLIVYPFLLKYCNL